MATIEKRLLDDGTPSYCVRIRLKGHPAENKNFRRLADAKRWATQTEAAIREGRHFKTVEARRHTAADMIDRYVREVLPGRIGDAENRRRQLLWWRDKIGPYVLADVTPALLAEHRDSLATDGARRSAAAGRPASGSGGKGRAPGTVNRYLAALSHCLTVAVKEWGWLDDSPMRRVRKPAEPRGRVRFLGKEELARLLDAARDSAEPMLFPLVVLALATGMRQGEILALTWADVDLDRGRVVLHETKNGQRRGVPIEAYARSVLVDWSKVRRIDSPLVFPDAGEPRPGTRRRWFPQHAWERAVRDAKIDDFRFHDLRHSCASHLAMNGASLMEIAEVLGHKTLAMVKRYAHLSETHTRTVVSRMNAAIFGDTGAASQEGGRPAS